MNVLGLQAFYYSHAAALVSGGELRWFCEEEKLSRTKGAREGFPLHATRAALAEAGIGLSDVDEIAFPWIPWRYAWTAGRAGLASFARGLFAGPGPDDGISTTPDRLVSLAPFLPGFLRPLIRQRLRHGGVPGRIPPVRFVSHHLAHAASGFFCSGYERASILIVDGMGESESTSIWSGLGRDVTRLDRVAFPNSLGEFYAAFTEFCGFKVYQQEGKLMGLAAYGGRDADLESRMDRVLEVGAESYRLNPAFTVGGRHSRGASYSDALIELFGEPRAAADEITDRHRAIAWAAQDRLERATLEMVKRAVRLGGSRDLCLSGGVAMNCKLNGVVQDSGLVDRVFVLPASNDAGAALGAAQWRARLGGDDPRFQLEHTYYGPRADDAEIEDALRHSKLRFERVGEAGWDRVAELLTERKVVGLYAGRNEFGARALGARSILADPRDKAMWDVVNESVKRREKWRPFAPVVLEGHEDEYFVDGRPSPFMMKAYQVRTERAGEIPAVVHVDGTARPQSIRADQNPVYHGILEAFHARTGVPVLMNTSFNVRGEPIVSTPFDALRCYLTTGMDALLIGSFLLEKDRD